MPRRFRFWLAGTFFSARARAEIKNFFFGLWFGVRDRSFQRVILRSCRRRNGEGGRRIYIFVALSLPGMLPAKKVGGGGARWEIVSFFCSRKSKNKNSYSKRKKPFLQTVFAQFFPRRGTPFPPPPSFSSFLKKGGGRERLGVALKGKFSTLWHN